MAHSCTCACVLHWDRRASYQWKWNMLHLIPPVQYLSAPPGRAEFATQHRAGIGQINISPSESIPLSLGAGQFLQWDDPPPPSRLPGSAGVQLNCWEL